MVRFFIKGNALATAAAVFVLVVAQLQTAAFAAEQQEFDYFVLSQRWPGVSCRDVTRCCSMNACCRSSMGTRLRFTIHGLWPEYNDATWPSCCTDEKFDLNEVNPLMGNLLDVWPTYQCDLKRSCHDRKTTFWAAQYEKHGTCAAGVLRSQYEYFSKAIDLYNKYPISKALEDVGILPSNNMRYPIVRVLDAVEKVFDDRTPKIICAEDGAIKEIWLCFDKDFNPRHCDASESCPDYVRLLPLGSRMGKGAIPRIAEVTEAVN